MRLYSDVCVSPDATAVEAVGSVAAVAVWWQSVQARVLAALLEGGCLRVERMRDSLQPQCRGLQARLRVV